MLSHMVSYTVETLYQLRTHTYRTLLRSIMLSPVYFRDVEYVPGVRTWSTYARYILHVTEVHGR